MRGLVAKHLPPLIIVSQKKLLIWQQISKAATGKSSMTKVFLMADRAVRSLCS